MTQPLLLGDGDGEGLHLLPPGEFLRDPLPRAREFLQRLVGQVGRSAPNNALNRTAKPLRGLALSLRSAAGQGCGCV